MIVKEQLMYSRAQKGFQGVLKCWKIQSNRQISGLHTRKLSRSLNVFVDIKM